MAITHSTTEPIVHLMNNGVKYSLIYDWYDNTIRSSSILPIAWYAIVYEHDESQNR